MLKTPFKSRLRVRWWLAPNRAAWRTAVLRNFEGDLMKNHEYSDTTVENTDLPSASQWEIVPDVVVRSKVSEAGARYEQQLSTRIRAYAVLNSKRRSGQVPEPY